MQKKTKIQRIVKMQLIKNDFAVIVKTLKSLVPLSLL